MTQNHYKIPSKSPDTFAFYQIPMLKIAVYTFLFIGYQAYAQTGQNFDPSAMAQREKQLMLDSLKGLSMDQVALIDVVYDSYATSVKNMRGGDQLVDREVMMQKMATIREEKNAMMKDILSAEQFEHYAQILANIRKNWVQRPN